MTKRQRHILSELGSACNDLGAMLDGTATNPKKYIDRQKAHADVYNVIYGVLCDDHENEFREEDVTKAEQALKRLQELKNKHYGDRKGF